jgi:hypothetical protein
MMSCDTAQIQTAIESGILSAAARAIAGAIGLLLAVAAAVLLWDR